jgi:hypothetical protein
MFIDTNRLVALEYIFYQKDDPLYKIKECEENYKFIHHLGTDNYTKGIDERSAFKDKPINFYF